MTKSTKIFLDFFIVGSLHEKYKIIVNFIIFDDWESNTWLCRMMKSLDGHTDNVLMNCDMVESNNAYKKDCKVHVRHPGNGYLD